MSPPDAAAGRYRSLRACRAVAAILLVCFHLSDNLAKDKFFGHDADVLVRIFALGGQARVAFFFVLSGFIITLIHRQDFGVPGRLLPYLCRRATRIYPTYVLVFACVYLGSLAAPSLREGLPTGLGVLVKSLLLLPQDPAVVGGTGAPVIYVAWSLQYEMVFYGVVGLGILHRRLFVGAVAMYMANLAWQLHGGSESFPGSFFANDLLLLFGIGAATAWVVAQDWRMPRPVPVAIVAGVLFFGFGAVAEALDGGLPLPLVHLGYGLFAAMLIVALVQAEQREPGRFGNRFAAVVGDASYALFLIHFPLLALLSKAAVAAGLHGVGGMLVSFVLILASCIAASVAFHQWIERPLLKGLAPRAASKPKAPDMVSVLATPRPHEAAGAARR
ncbi:acyltransferase [Variovorax sp. dw_308]|uniref:acyltransferase family protein n=1 Tax=Variovorax sp. dw_308 TaxID=2721546 RepID=UPI001C43E157|nr:acyltransferase [Variovorax sp. dw_308]